MHATSSLYCPLYFYASSEEREGSAPPTLGDEEKQEEGGEEEEESISPKLMEAIRARQEEKREAQ